MPIYEYECSGCGKVFEMMQKFSDPPLEVCPDCKGKVSKLISRSAFHLKGGGWYKTDYASSTNSTASSSTPKSEEKKEKASSSSELKKDSGPKTES